MPPIFIMKRGRKGNAGGVPGLFVFPNSISEKEEAEILHEIDASPQPWTQRRTRSSKDFGPYYRYQTIETDGERYRITDGVKRHTPLPPFLEEKIQPLIKRVSHGVLDEFVPNQLHVAKYEGEAGDRIHSHNDNKLGLCLVGSCKMTFTRPKDGKVRRVDLPKGCVYAMSGPSHLEWRHGIFAHHIYGPRISITLRDVRDLNMEEGVTTVTKSRFSPQSNAKST